MTAPQFAPVSWLPSVPAPLTAANVTIAGLTLAPEAAGHQIGDSVTVLAQATEGAVVRQWAVVFSLNDIKPEERALRSAPFTLYASTGRKQEFPASPLTGVLIHVFGPFTTRTAPNRVKDIWSGALVNPEFLGLGLDSMAAFLIRLGEATENNPAVAGQHFTLGVNSAPFPDAVVQANKEWIERIHVTDAEERAFTGMVPAFMDFFRIASQTPGVRDIVMAAMDVPWWSIVSHGGRLTDINFEILGPFEKLNNADWGLPSELPVYSIGFRLRLQGKPALLCRMAVTRPRPPLLATAGVVGMTAIRPNGKGPQLMVKVMAGKPATPALSK